MNFLKKVLILCIAFVCVFGCSAFADDQISVIVDGTKVEFDVQPQIIEGRTMLPMRKTFEAFGADIKWFEDIQLVLATYDTKVVAMEIGKDIFKVTDVIENTNKIYTLDVKSTIIDGRTLIPVRAVAESFGFEVVWDGETRTVFINK